MDQATHNKIVSFIWGIADDVLRDLFKRGKYPDVILPMCVIRRMDAVLEPTKQKVLDTKKMLDEAGITEQRAALCDAAGQAFYNTSKFTLRDLKSRGSQQQLLADFEDYLNGFSPNVQDILENFKFRNQLPTLSKNCPRCICTSPRLFAMSSEAGSRARALRNEASAPSRSPSVCSATPSCMWARAIAAFPRIDARRCSTAPSVSPRSRSTTPR